MPAPTNEDKLETARAMLAKIEATLGTLYEKTSQSLSFGDQSTTLASIRDLEASRDRWRTEIDGLESLINGKRRTIKVHFPC
jgi:hypothetical protein